MYPYLEISAIELEGLPHVVVVDFVSVPHSVSLLADRTNSSQILNILDIKY